MRSAIKVCCVFLLLLLCVLRASSACASRITRYCDTYVFMLCFFPVLFVFFASKLLHFDNVFPPCYYRYLQSTLTFCFRRFCVVLLSPGSNYCSGIIYLFAVPFLCCVIFLIFVFCNEICMLLFCRFMAATTSALVSEGKIVRDAYFFLLLETNILLMHSSLYLAALS